MRIFQMGKTPLVDASSVVQLFPEGAPWTVLRMTPVKQGMSIQIAAQSATPRQLKAFFQAVEKKFGSRASTSVTHEDGGSVIDVVLRTKLQSVSSMKIKVSTTDRSAGSTEVVFLLSESGAKWSTKVKTKWSPPEGLFTKSAAAIAQSVKRAHKTLKSAVSALTFYKNRAGKNLSKASVAKIDQAIEKLHTMYS